MKELRKFNAEENESEQASVLRRRKTETKRSGVAKKLDCKSNGAIQSALKVENAIFRRFVSLNADQNDQYCEI